MISQSLYNKIHSLFESLRKMDQLEGSTPNSRETEINPELAKASQDAAMAYLEELAERNLRPWGERLYPETVGYHIGEHVWATVIAQNPKYAGSIAALAEAISISYTIQRDTPPSPLNPEFTTIERFGFYRASAIYDTPASAERFLADLIIYRLCKGKANSKGYLSSVMAMGDLYREVQDIKAELGIKTYDDFNRIGTLHLQKLIQFILEGKLSIEHSDREEYTA